MRNTDLDCPFLNYEQIEYFYFYLNFDFFFLYRLSVIDIWILINLRESPNIGVVRAYHHPKTVSAQRDTSRRSDATLLPLFRYTFIIQKR